MISRVIVFTIAATCVIAQEIFSKYSDSEEVPEVNIKDDPPVKWDYKNHGTDWTMKYCEMTKKNFDWI